MIYLYILNNWVVATQYFLLSPRTLGKMNPFWLILFKWVGSTTNQTTVFGPPFFLRNGSRWNWVLKASIASAFGPVSSIPNSSNPCDPLGGRWWLRWRWPDEYLELRNPTMFYSMDGNGDPQTYVFYVSWVGNHHPIERTNKKWTFPKIGGKHPKWMVNIMENPIV